MSPENGNSGHGQFYERERAYGRAIVDADARLKVSLQTIAGLRPHQVLDIGCGDGFFALQIQERTGAEVRGLDVSHTAVDLAEAKGLSCSWCDLDRGIPFDAGSFDLVYCGEVLEHVVNPDHLLEEVHRVLVPRGHVVLSTPNLAAWFNRVLLPLGIQPIFSETSTRKVLGRHLKVLGQGTEPVGHLRLYTLSALRELVEMSGFTDVRVRGASFRPLPLFRLIDSVFARFRSLASILILVARKKDRLHG